jgi:hypothetical protein
VSRWPTDVTVNAHGARRAWPAAIMRRLRRRAPRHRVLLQSHGLLSWRCDLGPTTDDGGSAFDSVDAWCRAHSGCEATVLVSGHLLHSLVIDPALPAHGDEALREHARRQFADYHGIAAQQWPLAPWSVGGAAGVCALHGLDLDALRSSAARHGVHLRSVAPLWSAGLRSLGTRVPAFASSGRHPLALVEGRLVTWLVADSARVVAIQQRFLDAATGPALAELLDRLISSNGPLAELPLVVGWGLDAAQPLPPLRAHVLTPLTGTEAARAWVLDVMRAPA